MRNKLYRAHPAFSPRAAATGLGLLLFALVGPADAVVGIIPADRQTLWSPGIPGGAPKRTTICATAHASRYGNAAQEATTGIQAAINTCPVDPVVRSSAGELNMT